MKEKYQFRKDNKLLKSNSLRSLKNKIEVSGRGGISSFSIRNMDRRFADENMPLLIAAKAERLALKMKRLTHCPICKKLKQAKYTLCYQCLMDKKK